MCVCVHGCVCVPRSHCTSSLSPSLFPLLFSSPSLHVHGCVCLLRAHCVHSLPLIIPSSLLLLSFSPPLIPPPSQDGSAELVLDWSLHRYVAFMLSEAHSHHLPSHPGGRDYSPAPSGLSKVSLPLSPVLPLRFAWPIMSLALYQLVHAFYSALTHACTHAHIHP